VHLWSLEWLILAYFIIVVGWNYLLMFAAQRQLKKRQQTPIPTEWPSLTILVPAYNEEKIIVDSVNLMLQVNYPGDLKVAICDDGSTDNTFQELKKAFSLSYQDAADSWVSSDERVMVSRQVNKGRAGGLNGALRLASSDYVCATDADTILDNGGLAKIVSLMEHDKELEAAGGSILLANNIKKDQGVVFGKVPTNPIPGMQAVEYLRAFLYGRLGLNTIGGNVIISGAFGVFRTDTIRKLGAWNEDTVAEDFDMTVRIRKAGGKALFIPEPVAWTQAPESFGDLGRQRERWHRGLSQVLFSEGLTVIGRKKYGGLGLITIPAYFIAEWLAPIVEVIGIALYGVHLAVFNLGLLTAGGLFFLAWMLGMGLSIMAIRAEQNNFGRYTGKSDTLKLVLYSMTELFWYHPLTVWWRLKGLVKWLFRSKGWGKMTRKSFSKTLLVLPLLIAAPAVTDAQEWAEASYTVEAGEFHTRKDFNATLRGDGIVVEFDRRSRADLTDSKLGAYVWFQPGPLFIGGGVTIGLTIDDEEELFPGVEQRASVGVVVGPFVNTVDARFQNFDEGFDVALISNTTELYVGDWRVAFRGIVGTKDIKQGVVQVGADKENIDYMFYVGHGRELLDFPRFVGTVTEIGVTSRLRLLGPLHFTPGLSVGKRHDWRYFTVKSGLRIDL
jgi:cellulose synthase/poly-beta-1,6-N-acetylglucosamine synthase-like glycosyltransferase